MISVCFVTQEYPEETGWGGIGSYNWEMAHGLARAGHRVVVLARALTHPRQYTEEDGVVVHRIVPQFGLNRAPLFWRLNRLWEGYRLAVAEALEEIVRQYGIDLIETPDVHSEPLLFRAVRRGGPPIVVRLHSGNRARAISGRDSSVARRIDDLAEQLMLGRATAITAPSQAAVLQRDPAFPLPPRPCTVIPNPVDTELFRPLPDIRQSDSSEVLFLGRLESAKGLDTLLRAIPRVCAAVPEARFTLMGAGMGRSGNAPNGVALPLLPEGFADRVRIAEQCSRCDLAVAYARATLCVVPSRWEQFGYTCAEAMACGRAVVASRVGGLAEIVEDGRSGLLVPPGDSDALASAITRLLEDHHLRERLGEAARQRIVERFSTHAAIPRFVDFYNRVIAS